jgi:hypothetical protein
MRPEKPIKLTRCIQRNNIVVATQRLPGNKHLRHRATTTARHYFLTEGRITTEINFLERHPFLAQEILCG